MAWPSRSACSSEPPPTPPPGPLIEAEREACGRTWGTVGRPCPNDSFLAPPLRLGEGAGGWGSANLSPGSSRSSSGTAPGDTVTPGTSARRTPDDRTRPDESPLPQRAALGLSTAGPAHGPRPPRPRIPLQGARPPGPAWGRPAATARDGEGRPR